MIREHLNHLAALAAILAIPLASAACGITFVSPGGGCYVDGQSHSVGSTFDAGDGCNTCTCEPDGTAACTLMDCISGCFYDGVQYEVGDSFPAGDGCNTCSCDASGAVGCTEMACAVCYDDSGHGYFEGEGFQGPECTYCVCQGDGTIMCEGPGCPPPPPACEYNGNLYKPGESFPAGDGCNTCMCDDYGNVACTGLICPDGCTYAGVAYKTGESFPALDGCNTCTCGPGGAVGCTKMACACNPTQEWWRQYAATDPATCQVIDFGCPPNTTSFYNTCGCGCEQDASCPQYFDCMPPSPCDPAAIKAKCPYSGIAY